MEGPEEDIGKEETGRETMGDLVVRKENLMGNTEMEHDGALKEQAKPQRHQQQQLPLPPPKSGESGRGRGGWVNRRRARRTKKAGRATGAVFGFFLGSVPEHGQNSSSRSTRARAREKEGVIVSAAFEGDHLARRTADVIYFNDDTYSWLFER